MTDKISQPESGAASAGVEGGEPKGDAREEALRAAEQGLEAARAALEAAERRLAEAQRAVEVDRADGPCAVSSTVDAEVPEAPQGSRSASGSPEPTAECVSPVQGTPSPSDEGTGERGEAKAYPPPTGMPYAVASPDGADASAPSRSDEPSPHAVAGEAGSLSSSAASFEPAAAQPASAPGAEAASQPRASYDEYRRYEQGAYADAPTRQQPPVQPHYAQASSARDHVAAGLLAIFLGGFGVHKFYLGYSTQGFIMLAIFLLGGLLSFGFASTVIWIIAIVEGVIYLTKTQSEFEQIYVHAKREWF